MRSGQMVLACCAGVLVKKTGAGVVSQSWDGVLALNEITRKAVCFMRSKSRSVLVALVAVLALGTVASASASAAEWHVGGSALTGSAELASATGLSEAITLSSAGVTITCSSGLELKSADIAAKNGGKIEHLLFKGCLISAPCALSSTTIETKPLTLEAALGSKSPEDTLLLKPTTGTVFAEFKISGTSCSIAGVNKLTGQATFILPKGREELAEQELAVHANVNELEWRGEVSLKGKVKVKLVSGKGWSFH